MVGQQHLYLSPVQHNVQKDRIRSWSLDFASANATARRPSHSHTLVWGCADTCKPLHPSRAAIRRPSLGLGKDVPLLTTIQNGTPTQAI